MDEFPEFEPNRNRLRLLRRFRVLIVATTVAAVGVALVLSLRQDVKYQASAELSFQDVSQDVSILGSLVQVSETPATLAAKSAATLTRPEVISKVQKTLRTRRSEDQLRSAIAASADPQTNLVNVQATGATARFAADLANAAATAARDAANLAARNRFKVAARNLSRQLDEQSQNNPSPSGVGSSSDLAQIRALARFAAPANLVTQAEVPNAPSSPKPIRNAILAGFLGLGLGLGMAFFVNSLDRRLRTSHEIQSLLDLPLLGHVREQMMGKTTQAIAQTSPRARRSDYARLHDLEAFRILRANLDFLDVDSELTTVAVTSALPEEGKSTVAASLALAATSMGASTLLVECDLRRSSVARLLELEPGPGLTDYLAGNAGPDEIIRTVAVATPSVAGVDADGPVDTAKHHLVCITAGTANPRAGELLASERFREFLEEVAVAYDLVVIDTPPLLPVADTRSIVPHVDRVLLCVRATRTTRDQALSGKAALDRLSPPAVGLVVTGEQASEENTYGYYTPYSYEQSTAKS